SSGHSGVPPGGGGGVAPPSGPHHGGGGSLAQSASGSYCASPLAPSPKLPSVNSSPPSMPLPLPLPNVLSFDPHAAKIAADAAASIPSPSKPVRLAISDHLTKVVSMTSNRARAHLAIGRRFFPAPPLRSITGPAPSPSARISIVRSTRRSASSANVFAIALSGAACATGVPLSPHSRTDLSI